MNIWQDPVSMFFLGASVFMVIGLFIGNREKKERRKHYEKLEEIDEHATYWMRDQE